MGTLVDIATRRRFRKNIEQAVVAHRFLVNKLGVEITCQDVLNYTSSQRTPDVLIPIGKSIIGIEVTRITNPRITAQFNILDEINFMLLCTRFDGNIPYQITGTVKPNFRMSRNFVRELTQVIEENKHQIGAQIDETGHAYFDYNDIPKGFNNLRSTIIDMRLWPKESSKPIGIPFSMSYDDDGESAAQFTRRLEECISGKAEKQYQPCDELYLTIYRAETSCHDLEKALDHCKLWLREREWPFKDIYFLEARNESAEWHQLL
jgi:hypothetical protein